MGHPSTLHLCWAEKRISHLYPKVEVTTDMGKGSAGSEAPRGRKIVHHLISVLEAGSEGATAELLAKLGGKAEIAGELAYRASPRVYAICERKKRATEALSYNGLVQSWPEIMRLAQDQTRSVSMQHEECDSNTGIRLCCLHEGHY